MASFAGELASDSIHQDWHGLRPPRTRAPGGILLLHQVHLVVGREKETLLPLVFTLYSHCLVGRLPPRMHHIFVLPVLKIHLRVFSKTIYCVC